MALDSSRTQLRTITFVSAGAALLAVIGYLLMKSDRKKTKRKVTKSESKNNESIGHGNEAIQSVNDKMEKIELNENIVEGMKSDRDITTLVTEKLINEDNISPVIVPTSPVPKLELNPYLTSSSSNEPEKIDDAIIIKQEEPIQATQMNSFKIITLENNVETLEKTETDENILNEVKEISCTSSLIDSNSSKEEEDEDLDETSGDKKKPSKDMDKLSESSIDSGNVHSGNEHVNSNANINELDEKFEETVKNVQVLTEEVYKSIDQYQTSEDKLVEDIIAEPQSPSTKQNINKNVNNESAQLNNKNLNNNLNNTNSQNVNGNKKKSKRSESNSSMNISRSPSTQSASSKTSKRTKNTNNKIAANTKNAKKNYLSFQEQNQDPKSLTNIDLNGEDLNETDVEDLVVYEFNFPRKLCGKLIGKNGVHVDFIRSKTQTQIAVRNDAQVEDLQIVCVSGRISDVDKALDIIGHRFPSKLYPQISFKPISKPIVYRRFNNEKSSSPDSEQSKILVTATNFVELTDLIKNKNGNETIPVQVTAVVNAGHVFVQLPTHSTYNELQVLDKNMLSAYENMNEIIPNMNEPIEYGTICAAPTSYGWHRAMVTNYQTQEEITAQIPDYNEKCGLATVKFLDYGGYLNIPVNQLRQLRSDFMILPFQGIECYLDGVYPHQNLIEEGKTFLSQRLKDSNTDALVTGYSEDGIPQIRLFISNDLIQNLCVNNELSQYGLAMNYMTASFDAASTTTTTTNGSQNVQNLFNNNDADTSKSITANVDNGISI